jgi:RNA methyltransferase, TrmH family
MPILRITSKDNPLLRTLRLVAAESRRAPDDLVVVEGLRALEAASELSEVHSVLIADSFGKHAREQRLLELWASNHHTKVCQAPDAIVGAVSDVRTSQGGIALVRMPRIALAEAPEAPNPLVLCACALQDPGNLGTLIRAAAAAGATLICSTPGTVSFRNPKVIRASAGACFRIPMVQSIAPEDFLRFCRKHGIQVHATGAGGRHACYEADLASPTAVLLGSESSGISVEEWPGIPALRIPMAEGVESLNVAVAGAILLYEAFRQRNAVTMARKELTR